MRAGRSSKFTKSIPTCSPHKREEKGELQCQIHNLDREKSPSTRGVNGIGNDKRMGGKMRMAGTATYENEIVNENGLYSRVWNDSIEEGSDAEIFGTEKYHAIGIRMKNGLRMEAVKTEIPTVQAGYEQEYGRVE